MATPDPFDPLTDLVTVQKRMNQLFETALARTDFEAPGGLDAWTPTSDVYDGAEDFVLCLELPGIKQEEIDLRLDEDDLLVEGKREMGREQQEGERFHRVERSYGKFSRRFRLPSSVDQAAVQASYRNGVLTVRLPKKDGEGPRTRRVTIE
ncbi:MAG: Hsp20/alpha crystallin family protein [bacterium]|nr:Hsp20/alpha crystallin family protein [bacterium]